MSRLVVPEIEVVDAVNIINPIHEQASNGADIYYLNGCDEDIVQVDLVLNSGRKFQTRALQASFTADMLMEGSSGKSGADVMNDLDSFGAYVDISTGLDRITVSVFSTIRHLASVLDRVKKILLEPNFSSPDFDLLKTNKRQNFLIQSEKVAQLSRRAFYKTIFKGHSYGLQAELKDYETLQLEELKAYYGKTFWEAGLTCFVGGKITNDVRRLVDGFVSDLPKGSGIGEIDTLLATQPSKVHVEKDGVQCGLRIGKSTIQRGHEDYMALQVLMVAFGGYFGSRLMKNIREDKGYTYGIGAGLMSYDHGGILFIATEIGNQYVKNTLSEIRSEILILRENVIPENEFQLVKNYISGSVARSLDGAFEQLEKFKTIHFAGLSPNYYNDYLNTVKNIQRETILEMAQRYLSIDDCVQVTAGKAT